MSAFTTAISLQSTTLNSIQSLFNPLPILHLLPHRNPPSSTLKFRPRINPKKPRKFVVCAKDDGSGPTMDPNEEREKKGDEGLKNNGNANGNGGEGEDVQSNGRPTFNVRWVDLLLDPDPDNILAVGLTGVLAWASAQVLWQLFFISVAIIVAALKYSFIAALLIFIIITLL
ncbi:hypothetical protein U1Q18_039595 [Sarracenia purpurea var. burkii]